MAIRQTRIEQNCQSQLHKGSSQTPLAVYRISLLR